MKSQRQTTNSLRVLGSLQVGRGLSLLQPMMAFDSMQHGYRPTCIGFALVVAGNILSKFGCRAA